MDDKEFWLESRRKSFEAGLESSFARAQRVPVLNVIPGEYFSRASTECREMFIQGNFFGCVALAQSVAEGLSRFLVKTKSLPVQNMDDHRSRYSLLWRGKIISDKARDAFKLIHGDDRNDFHHMNETVPTGYMELEARAEECLMSLFKLESEVFAHRFDQGKLVPVHPEYWPKGDKEGTVTVELRQHF